MIHSIILITQGNWKGWKGYNGTNQQVQRSNIAGECACRSGYYFDDISLSCQETTFDFNSVWIIVGFAIVIFVSLLCCRFCLFGMLRRQMIFPAYRFYKYIMFLLKINYIMIKIFLCLLFDTYLLDSTICSLCESVSQYF